MQCQKRNKFKIYGEYLINFCAIYAFIYIYIKHILFQFFNIQTFIIAIISTLGDEMVNKLVDLELTEVKIISASILELWRTVYDVKICHLKFV